MARERRKDSHRAVLKKGELQRPNGTYSYSWYDANGKRHYIYGKTLEELRTKETEVAKNGLNGLNANGRYKTLNDVFETWKEIKRGLKLNTFENYKYMYTMFVKDSLGKQKVTTIRKTTLRIFYNTLMDERGLTVSTLDSIQTVIHQLFDIAVEDGYIAFNPSDNVLKEVKNSHSFKTEKRRGLTKPEQELFLKFLRESPVYRHWYPVFAVLVGTGLRVGEFTGLRWCDIDLDKGIIDVNHTLVYFNHRDDAYRKGCYFACNTPKTVAGIRQIPMLGFVKDAFIEQKRLMEENGIECKAFIDGYTDFIFLNKDGMTLHQGILNKAIRRITRDCNDNEFEKNPEPEVLLPHFSCHNLRHTFTTRLVEAGTNIKVAQTVLGHRDIKTTLDIYADCTQEMLDKEFNSLEASFRVS